MSAISFLLDRLRTFDPTLETDRQFQRDVLEPLRKYLGEGAPKTDIAALIQAQLSEEFPDVQTQVLADVCGRVAALFTVIIQSNIQAGLARGRWSNPELMTLEDIRATRDFFFTEPDTGSYARGVIRAMFMTPRNFTLLPNALLLLPARNGKPDRFYRPAGAVSVGVEQMRQQRASGMYYVDVPVVASAVGAQYNAEASEGAGLSGIPGAAHLRIVQRLDGGTDADDLNAYGARIATSARLRTLATVAGAQFVLPQLGAPRFYLATGGDRWMLRDRIYGAANVSGIPGGITAPDPDSIGDFVSIGLAWDVYVPPITQALVQLRLTNLTPLEASVLWRGDFRLSVTQLGEGDYRLTSAAKLCGQVCSDLSQTDGERFLGPVSSELIAEGDWVTTDAFLSVATDVRRLAQIVEVEDPYNVRVQPSESDESVWEALDGVTPKLRVFSQANSVASATARTIPLRPKVAVDVNGDVARTGTNFVEPEILTGEPLVVAGFRVPQRTNVIAQPVVRPIVRIDRAELLDPVSLAPSGDYVYSAAPFYVEFVGPAVNASPGLNGPVRVRVHLQGPAAMAAVASYATDDGNFVEITPGDKAYTPLEWPAIGATVESTSASEGAVLRLSGMFTSQALADADGGQVLDGLLPRTLRAGDHVLFDTFALPITEIVDLERIKLAAADLPVGATYTGLRLLQGTSRAVQLATGRGEEGTYWFDVFVTRSFPAGDSTDAAPPAGTTAVPSLKPWHVGNQGFQLTSCAEGEFASPRETPTLVLLNGYLADSKEVLGRSLVLHCPDPSLLSNLQNEVQSEAARPVVSTGLVKAFPPTFLTLSVYYEGDLPAQSASAAILAEVARAQGSGRVDLSDLLQALSSAGATNIVSGRLFAHAADPLRRWSWAATRDSIPLLNSEVGTPIMWSLTCTKLWTRRAGQPIVPPTDPSAQEEVFVYRHGGFNAD